jgi:hypothetical protein
MSSLELLTLSPCAVVQCCNVNSFVKVVPTNGPSQYGGEETFSYKITNIVASLCGCRWTLI